MSSALDRLKNLTAKISSYEVARKENMEILKELYKTLEIDNKHSEFEEIFAYKAMNLSGVSLSDEDLGTVREGKYMQIIAIKYNPNAKTKSQNISLGYFGRAEKVDEKVKNSIITFVLRWRFEKSFKTLEHYHDMIGSVKKLDV